MVTVGSLGALLQIWRRQAGMTIEEMAAALAQILGKGEPTSVGVVKRYEADSFGKGGPNSQVLTAWAVISGHGLDEYPEEIRSQIQARAALFDELRSR